MAVFGNIGGKVPVSDIVLLSHEQVIYPTTSLVVDKIFIDFEFQTDSYYYDDLRQTYLAWNRNLSRVTVTKNTTAQNWKKERKEHKEEAKRDVETAAASEEDEEAPASLVTHVNNILHSILTMLKSTLTINKNTIPMDSMGKSPTFPKTSRRQSLSTRGST